VCVCVCVCVCDKVCLLSLLLYSMCADARRRYDEVMYDTRSIIHTHTHTHTHTQARKHISEYI